MKKLNKFLFMGLAVLSISVPVFAEVTPDAAVTEAVSTVKDGAAGKAVVSESTLTLPTISVTLPTTHGFIVNPYNLENAGQIVSSKATISNASDVAVEVSLKSATAVIAGETTTSKAVLGIVTDKITTKTVELNLVVTPTATKATLHAPELGVNITGKNTATKLVTLNKTDGEATLEYTGKVVANPTTSPWSSEDKITINAIYSFVPVSETP